jgi:hypothetical protein
MDAALQAFHAAGIAPRAEPTIGARAWLRGQVALHQSELAPSP